MAIEMPKTIGGAIKMVVIMILLAIGYGAVKIINTSVEEVLTEPAARDDNSHNHRDHGRHHGHRDEEAK